MQKTHKTDLGNVSYSSIGKGDVILFLHGFLGNKKVWTPFVNHFKPNYQVITIDLPGHGKTSIIEEEMTMEFSAKLIKQILETEHLLNIHIVGHSMGGYIGLAFAKLYPKTIKSLTLFNCTAYGDTKQKQADRLKAVRVFDMNPSIFIDEAIKNLFYKPNLTVFSKEVQELTEMAKTTPAKGAQGSLRGMRIRDNHISWLSKQKFPLHFIAGEYDNTIPFSTIKEQVEITNANLTTLTRSGHMGFVENQDTCIKAIEDFISI
jgi:pimeloyl-ACP methyl ester carboxylesterase